MATEIVESGSVIKIRMRREINLLYSIAIMTGVIIGSGIFVSPVSITQNCGSIGLSLVFWAVTGLITLCMVLCYAELGCCYPRAGGEYAYFREILGPVPAFLNVWIQFVVIKPTFQAILALTTTNYLFYPLYPDCSMPTAANKLVSMWILRE